MKPPPWSSFYIFLPGSRDTFLLRDFKPAVLKAIAEGHFRRFFFIRYSTDREHYRIRILPSPSCGIALQEWMCTVVEEFRSAQGFPPGSCELTEEKYDRSELYFGETPASVYSELLNEQTSLIAFQLMENAIGRRRELTVALTGTLEFLFRKAATDSPAGTSMIRQSQTFASRTLQQHNWRPGAMNPALEDAFSAALDRVSVALAPVLENNRVVARIVRLLRRARRGPSDLAFAATHALHLLCAKAGFSLVEEYRLYFVLAKRLSRPGDI